MNYLDLPVYRHKELILGALEKNQVLVVESPAGSGKTTQLPVILYEAGYGKNGIIAVTQPRRIAALSVSGFIARQMGFSGPGTADCPVGYKMRFEDKTGAATQIKIMTDGILLQEMKLDPWLSRYGVMIIDEAHERSLTIDFILGLLKRVLEERKEFKVIVSSATINAEVFSEYFGECPVVKIDAQTFPVTMVYDPPVLSPPPASREERNGQNRKEQQDGRRQDGRRQEGHRQEWRRQDGRQNGGGLLAQEALLLKIEGILERFVDEKRPGDILVFLPGEKMIKDCMNRLVSGSSGKNLHVIPLYGRLGREEQERVFESAPRGKTKVVVSTNIAETSVTIDGITAVLDSGLSKLNYYSPRTFTSSLVESPVSKASANQRKGRAGRTREGTCYRLYTRKDFESRPLFTTEEIYRTDLSEVVLRMADLGITDYEDFDFISPPGRDGLTAAVETLNLLDALEEDRTLSSTGKMMTAFPLGPRHSRIIAEAILRYPQVVEETIIAAAFLSTQSPYILPPGEETDARKAHHGFRDKRGDFVSYLKLYRAHAAAADKTRWCEKNYLDERAMAEIANVAAQLSDIVSDMKIPVLSGGNPDDYLSCVGRGLIQFVCVRERSGGEMYRSLTADRIMIHPGSVMFKEDPRYIVAGEIVKTTRTYAMSVSPLSPEIIARISPLLVNKLGGETGGEGKRERGERDFTNSIKLGGEIFPIKTVKGKKTVTLSWEKLARLKPGKDGASRESLPSSVDPSRYRGLRAVITLKTCTFMAGEKLSLILTLLPSLELDGALSRTWPQENIFYSADKTSLDALVENLSLVMLPARHKKNGKELGFIALFSGGNGAYRFRSSRGFHTALNESMASLESLVDDLGEDVDIEIKHRVNQSYRRLADLLGE